MLKLLIDLFTKLTALVLFVTAVYIEIFWEDALLDVSILWEILITCALCSLVAVLWRKEDMSKKRAILSTICTCLYNTFIVMGSGYLYKWYLPDQLPMILGLMACILFVFVIMFIYQYRAQGRLANKMTESLEKRRQKNEPK
ncbi:MAG: DUF3021 family protein [Lachnospiraceae bacterium]|nr:DUF3021 family protein [Lachnospiraceae bacterium]